MENSGTPQQCDFAWLNVHLDSQPPGHFQTEDMCAVGVGICSAQCRNKFKIETTTAEALDEMTTIAMACLDDGMNVADFPIDSTGLAMWPRAGELAHSRSRRTVRNNCAKRVAPDSDSDDEAYASHAEEAQKTKRKGNADILAIAPGLYCDSDNLQTFTRK